MDCYDLTFFYTIRMPIHCMIRGVEIGWSGNELNTSDTCMLLIGIRTNGS